MNKPVEKGISYLKNSRWEFITREERYFCSCLYHCIKKSENTRNFVSVLNELQFDIDDDYRTKYGITFENSLNKIEAAQDWDVGYEVCFYRDLLYNYGFSIEEVNRDNKAKICFPKKRTFDLCLFSNKDIVIIEAKAHQGLENAQLKNFDKDAGYIIELFDFIAENCLNKKTILQRKDYPAIHLVILASRKYYHSQSFYRTNGLGKKLLTAEQEIIDPDIFRGFISWEQLKEKNVLPGYIATRADALFGRKTGEDA